MQRPCHLQTEFNRGVHGSIGGVTAESASQPGHSFLQIAEAPASSVIEGITDQDRQRSRIEFKHLRHQPRDGVTILAATARNHGIEEVE